MGRSELTAVANLLRQALIHWLKAEAWPEARDAPSWRAASRDSRGQAANTYTPSMRQKIDLAQIHRRALNALPVAVDGTAPRPVREACPFTLNELLADDRRPLTDRSTPACASPRKPARPPPDLRWCKG